MIPPARHRRRARGLTLLELVTTLAIVTVVVSYALPSFALLAEKQRLSGAAETLLSALQLARSAAIKNGQPVRVTLRAGGDGFWCYGLRLNAACDCRHAAPAADSCRINGVPRQADSTAFRGIRLDQPPAGQPLSFSFSPLRGTSRAGRIEFVAPSGRRLRLVRSSLGRLRLCTPTSRQGLGAYPPC